MARNQINITLGTAGHIDHGKTALVKLLTGCDTDRLKEEKERGMSIELGFAPCLVSGTEIGIVDVPGHEHFIKTMVAGATGIDGVILVIAADDGVMPQTREHMDILTLLGVRHGIIALTKVDSVTADRVQTVTGEIVQFLGGTFLEGAPVLPISNITGQGFQEFYEALQALVAAISPRSSDGLFRVPLERAFSAKGYGTIVAGIPARGAVAIGDEVVLLPQGKTGRVRAIQVYGRDSATALVGQCAALNVPQWDHKEVQRGDVMTIPGYFTPQDWYLCELRMLPHERMHLKNGSQVKFHTGTSETAATVYLFQDTPLEPGQQGPVQVRLNQPVVAGPCDSFIVRSLSPVRTIGGGIVVEAIAGRLKRHHPDVLADIHDRARAVKVPDDWVEYCVRSAESLAVDERQVSLRSKVPQAQVAEILARLQAHGRLRPFGGRLYVHLDTEALQQRRLGEMISEHHRQQPQSPGVARETLLAESGIRKEVFDGLIEGMLSAGMVAERKGLLALPEHREQFQDGEHERLNLIESLFLKRPFNPPGAQEVMEATGAASGDVTRAIRILIEQQRLVRVDQDLHFHVDAVAEARRRLISHIQGQGPLESVKFKYLLDTTRKYAIPLLDYFDKVGLTRRVGYTRHLNNSG